MNVFIYECTCVSAPMRVCMCVLVCLHIYVRVHTCMLARLLCGCGAA